MKRPWGSQRDTSFDILVDICIADFDFNGNYLKLRCTNLYFKSLFHLHDYSSASLVRASVVRGTSVVRGFKRQIFSSHFYF